MKSKMLIFIVFIVSITVINNVNADTFCQSVNMVGLKNAPQLAKAMNKMLSVRGVKYRTSTKEIKNVINSYCRSNPLATEDDATAYLNTMADTLAAAGG